MSLLSSLLSAIRSTGIGGRQARIDDHRRLIRLGRDKWKYCEDDKCLTFQTEIVASPSSYVIYASTIRCWLPPHDAVEISVAKRTEIAEAAKAALAGMGDRAEIDWS